MMTSKLNHCIKKAKTNKILSFRLIYYNSLTPFSSKKLKLDVLSRHFWTTTEVFDIEQSKCQVF